MKTTAFILASATVLTLGLGSATAGPCTAEIDSLDRALAAKDAGSGPTPGASAGSRPATSTAGQHPPTAAMSQESQGKATSAEDARRQSQGQPTAAQEGNTGAATDRRDMGEATAALARARDFDRRGREADCMASVRQARQLSGSK